MEYYFESLQHPTVTVHSYDLNFLPHLHSEAEIITVLDGQIHLTLNGSTYILQAGDCAFIQPNQIHSYQSQTNHCLITIFDPSLVPSVHHMLYNTKFAHPICKSNDDFLYALNKLTFLSIAKDSSTLIKGYLYVILSFLNDQLIPVKQLHTEFTCFQNILLYVNAHYDKEITIANTAKKFGVSYEHLSRLYRAQTGLNFSEHVRLLRISKAKQLLNETTLSISEISECCGYTNERTFYRAFQAVTQKTPRQYMASTQHS